jgi:hypothetical protein
VVLGKCICSTEWRSFSPTAVFTPRLGKAGEVASPAGSTVLVVSIILDMGLRCPLGKSVSEDRPICSTGWRSFGPWRCVTYCLGSALVVG